MSKKAAIIAVIMALAAGSCLASSRLFYVEAQAVAGYNFTGDDSRVYWYSMDQMDVMQKPSLGFDYIQRLSSAGGDWGMLAVQARLAYDSTVKHDVEPQLYNAYLKVKPGFGDIWLGHNKPAFGLAMSLDNHGTILQPPVLYDRDWGIGYYRDFAWGNVAASATTGSGMPLVMRGNRLFSARAAKGDLSQDNYTIGLSTAYGKTILTMGYHTSHLPPQFDRKLGIDATLLRNRFEHRMEFTRHSYSDPANDFIFWNAFYRISMNLLDENRLKLELQVNSGWHKVRNEFYQNRFSRGNFYFEDSFGISYLLTEDLSFRFYFIDFDIRSKCPVITAQLYWYHKI